MRNRHPVVEADGLVWQFRVVMAGGKPNGRHLVALTGTIVLGAARLSNRIPFDWSHVQTIDGQPTRLEVDRIGRWKYWSDASGVRIYVLRGRDGYHFENFDKDEVNKLRRMLEEILAKSGKKSPW